jgi:hypothetical protein
MSEHILAHKHQAHKHQTHNHAAHGWRIHCGVEVTELSTNKQHTLSLTNKVRKDATIVKTANLYLMSTSDEDTEHTIGRIAALRPTLDHKIIYLAGENLKL